ncbi:MAG: PQQ-binding-like beta-propeller repeat protein, partial [Acidobacteriota bacterium]
LTVDERWRRPIGAGYSGIAIVDGRLYTMTSDGETDAVVALDQQSGEERWRADAGPTRPGGPGQLAGPSSTPAVAHGKVFALTPSGRLMALAADDGSIRWQRDLVADLGAEVPQYGIATAPLIDGQRVIVLVGGEEAYLAAFDVATGELVWSEGHGEGTSYASPIKATLGSLEQILVPSGNALYAVDPSDGNLLWSYDHGPQGMIDRMPLVLPEDRLFLPLMSGGVMLALRPVDRQSAAEGISAEWQVEELWQTPRLAQNTHSPPLYHDGHLYGMNGSLLVCLSADDGSVRWRSRVYDGTLILVDRHLVVMSAGSGKLHLVRASPDRFDEVLQTPLLETGHHTVTPPSYADRTLFIRNVRELVALELRPARPSDRRPPTVAVSAGKSRQPTRGLRERWRRPLATGIESAGNAGLAADGGRVFTIVTDATDEHTIALDANDGRELWRRPLGARSEGRDTGLASTPAVAGGRLVTLSATCRLRAHSPADGEVLWQHDLNSNYGARNCRTSPRLIDGSLVLQTAGSGAGRVVALRPADGTVVWAVEGAGPSTGASLVGATLGGVPQALAHGYTIRDGGPKSELYSLRLADGKILWRFGAEKFYSWADPLVAGEHVMLPTWRHSYQLRPQTAPDAPTDQIPQATELWRSEMLDSAVYLDGFIYAYTGDELVAVDAADGTFRWRDRNHYGKVTLAGDRLYILAHNTGLMRVVDATPEGYRERVHQQVVNPGAVNHVPPLISDGKVFLRNQEELVALERDEGTD